jgi:hypothetical protein
MLLQFPARHMKLFQGGAIFVEAGVKLEIYYTKFISNAASFGGAVYLYQSTLMIGNTAFSANTASEGGAIYFSASANATVAGCNFTVSANKTKGNNDVSRYDSTSNVTFACPKDEQGAPFKTPAGELMPSALPPAGLKCNKTQSSYLCNPDSKKCQAVPGGVPLSHCQVGPCAPAVDPMRRIQERQALELFAKATTSPASDGWVHACQAGWKGNLTDVCARYGITCEPPSNGYVTTIDLSSCGLTGIIPPNTVFTLQDLKEVHLRSEAYKGLIGLHGSLPSDLSSCTALEVIDFNSNNLEGKMPSLAKLVNLKTIDVHYNKLNGLLPSINSLAISYISFAGNGFTGTIPSDWSALKEIDILGLANNKLSGTADIITQFPKLLVVFLRNNSFVGEIPKLPKSTAVADFDHNKFSSIATDICSPNAPPAFDKPCGCTSDYPSQPFATCCFANNNFSYDPSKPCMQVTIAASLLVEALIPVFSQSCFSEQPCPQH